MAKKIKVIGKTLEKVDLDEIAQRLGAVRVDIPELTKTESEKYEPVGSPIMVPEADILYIYSNGHKMLSQYGISLDNIVGYRVLDSNEEQEFRKLCQDEYSPIVRFYSDKKK